ncbi:TlpA family protein disulfide reductase [Schleiferia thermophila]|uniref:TlpA family protein disulfide reductase n=1 Tax=Schleiferia thermophila TaxID=884107 RepID=UPI003EEBD4B8
MNVKNTFFQIVLVSAAFVSCSLFSPKEQAVLNMDLQNTKRIAILMADTVQAITIDSLDVPSSGRLSYKIKLSEPGFYVLDLLQGKRIPLYLEPGDYITIKADATADYDSDEISGSEGVEILNKINRENFISFALIDSLESELSKAESNGTYNNEIRTELDAAYEKRVKEHQEALYSIIEKYYNRLPVIFAFYQSLGQLPLVSPVDKFELFEKVEEGLRKKHPNNMHTIFFANRNMKIKEALEVERKRKENAARIKEGNPMPEIALANDAGEIIKLSSLKGKVVLVDFWAAWCRPCRMNNPKIVTLYNKYKDKGFTVYSVSLDGLPNQPSPRDAWQNAIKDDQLNWPYHVSELMGWNSNIVNEFGIENIPYTILVDKNGNIAAVNPPVDMIDAIVMRLL